MACSSAADSRSEDLTSASPLIDVTISTQFSSRYWGHGRTIYYTDVEPEATISVSDKLDLYAHLVMEPDGDLYRQGGKDPSEILYAEELYLRLKLGAVWLQLGKQDPMFGPFADHAPGMFAKDIADTYDLTGAMGIGLHIPLSSEEHEVEGDDDDDDNIDVTTEQALDVSVFSRDETFFARSLPRGASVDAFADLSATRQSFSIAYSYTTSYEDDSVAGPFARLALRRLAFSDAAVETGLLLSAGTAVSISPDWTAKPSAEIAWFNNKGGVPGRAVTATAAVEFDRGPWSLSGAAGLNDRLLAGTGDYLLTADVGYRFDTPKFGKFRIDVGYDAMRHDNEKRTILGIGLTKDITVNW